jgi:hypothetical protein
MFSSLWGKTSTIEKENKDNDSVFPRLLVPPLLIHRFQERNLTIKQPCSQTVMFVDKQNKENVFVIKVCPVWDIETKQIVKRTLQCKQMYHPHSREFGVFEAWLSNFSFALTIKQDEIQISSNPVRIQNPSNDGMTDCIEIWTLNIKQITNDKTHLNIWAIGHTFEHHIRPVIDVASIILDKSSDTTTEDNK